MDVSQSPSDAVAATKSDSAPNHGFGFMVAVAGDVAIETLRGNNVTLPACAAGVQYSVQFNKIRATGTTATGIVIFR